MSRKISEQAVDAFLAGRAWKNGNTEVRVDHDGSAFLDLHGNTIAFMSHGEPVGITTSGWNTVTTRERLNALPGVQVRMVKGQLHLNGQPWDGLPKNISTEAVAL